MKKYPCGIEVSGGLVPLPDDCPIHGDLCGTVDELVVKLRAAYADAAALRRRRCRRTH